VNESIVLGRQWLRAHVRQLILAAFIGLGAWAGVLLLHPVTMAVYWYEFNPDQRNWSAAWWFMVERMRVGFSGEMLPMAGVFVLIGGGLGLAFGLLSRALARRQQVVDLLERELRWDLYSLISHGESERVEFKATVRWDMRESRVNRGLEAVIARSIAGFMNHQGGSLIIGVDDSGDPIGLERDYATLKRSGRDGFQQCLVGIVQTYLGTDLCPLVHVLFHDVGHKDVCRVVIEPAPRPVYFLEHGEPHYVLRAGNACRELDVREAMQHIAARWPQPTRHRVRRSAEALDRASAPTR